MPAGRPKGSGGVNKSAAIREYLNSHPEASTTEVMEALGQKGVDVSQALVAGVRAKAFTDSPGNKKREKSELQGEITAVELKAVHTVIEKFEEPDMILSVIDDVCGLIKTLGSVARLEKALEAYVEKPAEEINSGMQMSSESEEEEEDDDDDDDEEEEEEDDDEEEDE